MIRIFRLLIPASVFALFLTEAVLIFACYAAVPYFQGDGELFLFYESGWQQIAVAEGLMLFVMYFRHLYEDPRVISRIQLAQQLSLVMGVTFITQALIGYWDIEMALPRDILIAGSALSLVAIFLCRVLFSLALLNKIGGRRLLFVGLSPTVIQLAKFLRQHPEFQLNTIGYLDEPEESLRTEEKPPLLGPVGELPRIMEEYHPDWIVVARREELQPRLLDDFIELRFGGTHTEQAASLYETTLGRVRVSEIQPSALVFSDALQPNMFNLKLQSFYSKTVALAIGAIALPLVAILALLMKASSRTPRLLRETRLGINAQPFTMYRFVCSSGRIGRFSSAIGLDAYPQLWNVLRGEMSIVGPSPDRPAFAARLSEAIPLHMQRMAVKPGITGWAQINTARFGSPTDVMGRLEYDLYYVKNLSPSLDLSVMLRTVREALTWGSLAAA